MGLVKNRNMKRSKRYGPRHGAWHSSMSLPALQLQVLKLSQKGSPSCEARQALCCTRQRHLSRQDKLATWRLFTPLGPRDPPSMTGVTEKHSTGKEKQGPEQEALPSALWQPVSHSPLWQPFAGPFLQCPRLPCLSIHSLEMPTKGLCVQKASVLTFLEKMFAWRNLN